jgi:hypothetical protein
MKTNQHEAKHLSLLSKASWIAGIALSMAVAHAGPILVNYQVDDSFTGVPGLTNADVFTTVTGSLGDILTLTYAPEEPGAAVIVPTNTAFDPLFGRQRSGRRWCC